MMRTACVLAASIAFSTTAAAFEAPPCAPPELVILEQPAVAALLQVVGLEEAYELHFSSAAGNLGGLAVGDILLLPPTSELPGGVQGDVAEVAADGAGIVITVERASRWPEPITDLAGRLLEQVVPDASDRVCQTIGTSSDVDLDTVLDEGEAAGQCTRDNGGEYGFELEIVDGVVLNGLLSIAPFDIEAAITFSEQEMNSFSAMSTGRISFSGELSASVDAVLDDTRPFALGSFVVATHVVDVPGMGALIIDIVADAYAGACGNASAGLRAGVTSSGIARVGVSYSASNNPLPELTADLGDSTVDLSPPQLAGDTPVDVTIYGGARLRTRVLFSIAGGAPVGLATIDLNARGSAQLQVDPAADEWWTISGRPEVYVDIAPQVLAYDLTNFTFDVINPPATTFFTSQSEFPFPAPTAADTATRDPVNEAGSALRWSRVLGTEEAFRLVDLATAADGGALAVGSGATGVLVRTDYRGERLWQRQIEVGQSVYSAQQLDDDSFVVAGVTAGDLILTRISDQGDELWSSRIEPTDGNIQSVHIASAGGGELKLGGEYQTSDGGNEFSPWAASLTGDGTVNWFRRYGLPGTDERINAVAGLSDGGLMLVGQTTETPDGPSLPGANAYTLRVAADGSVLWSHVWASGAFEQLLAAHQAPDGSFLVAGETGGTNLDTAPRGLIMRFDDDATGTPTAARWVRAISGSRVTPETFYDRITALTDARDGFVVAGSSGLGDERTAWLARLVESGARVDLLWSYFHDGFAADEFVTLANIGDGVLVGGNSASFGADGLQEAIWLTRAPLNGFVGWNDLSGAAATPTLLVLDEPLSYPQSLDQLNITAEAMLTTREQAIDVATVAVAQDAVVLTAIAVLPQELIRAPLPYVDSDADGVADPVDNCIGVPNADQRDSNDDGFGNLCDADLNDDGITNAVDLGLFRLAFFSDDADADLNGDGVVNVIDLGRLRQLFFLPPGPSGLSR